MRKELEDRAIQHRYESKPALRDRRGFQRDDLCDHGQRSCQGWLEKRIVPAPEAPSLICMDKGTGKVIWQDNSPGKDILEGAMVQPPVAEINGRTQVIALEGDGWVRSFDAETGKLI